MATDILDLVIFRHGEAEGFVTSDDQRQLTENGRKVTLQQSKALLETGFIPDVIIHSPFVRTNQTASICHSVFSEADIKSDTLLLHGANPEQVPMTWNNESSVLLVSHMPLVGRLIQYLCPQSNIYGLPVAGFVRMSLDKNRLQGVISHDGTSYERNSYK